MTLALQEAQKGGRAVRPNPLVGCAVETLSGQVLVAYHERYGEAHAERNLMERCERENISLEGARMAVTLEPCSHFGKTPPCSAALVKSKISELYVALQDPFPKVNGRGIDELNKAGIKVETGCLQKQAEDLNHAWLFAQRTGRAHLTLKMATSLDGGWATEKGISKWITSVNARVKAHELRKRVDVLLSSFETVKRDNPSFTAREKDESLATDQPQVMILSRQKVQDLKSFKVSQHPKGVEWKQNIKPHELLKELAQRGMNDVMLEAGPQLSQYFLEENCVDEIWCFMDTQFLGGHRLGFPKAFNSGQLPGAEFEIRKLEQIDERTVFLKLIKK